MASIVAAARRNSALLIGLELIPLLGTGAFGLVFVVAYALTPRGTPSFVTAAIASVLVVLLVTPLVAGAGWLAAGYQYIGGLVLLARGVTLIAATLILVDGAPTWIVSVVIAFVAAEPVVSAVALTLTLARRSGGLPS